MQDFNSTLREIYAIAVLLTASLWDLRRREVSPKFWYQAAKLVLPFTLYDLTLEYKTCLNYYIKVSLILDILIIVIYAFFFALGFLGGADVGAIAFIVLTTPTIGTSTFSVSLPVGFVSGLLGSLFQLLFYSIYICMLNLKDPSGNRGFKCFLRLRTKAYNLVNKRWWFVVEGKSLREFSIEEWPHESLALTIGSKGWEADVEASPAVPHIPFLTLGYLVVMIVTILI